MKKKQKVSVQLPTSAETVALPTFAAACRAAAQRLLSADHQPCSNRSISATRRAHSSKPATAACGDRTMGQTDRQTDAQMTNSFILSHAQYAGGAKNGSRLGNYSRETLTYLQLCRALVRDFCKNESKSCRQSTHRSALDCTLECCSKNVTSTSVQISHHTISAAFNALCLFFSNSLFFSERDINFKPTNPH